MNRRLAVGAAAVGAAAIGGAAGFLLQRRHEDPAVTALWALELDAPDGRRLALSSFRGRPLLLNFWATWCPPCVREMPMIDGFFRQHAPRGWQVLGVAADNPRAVREYLARAPVGYAVALAGLEGVDLARSLGNGSGGLPFSVAFDRGGQARERHVGELRAEVLEAWAASIS